MSIKVNGLCFSYGEKSVLQDVSFTAERGEFLSILGPNGAGKSTLFRCILGLLPGYSGEVLINGQNRKALSVREAARQIAYIPQSSHCVFHYSVLDIVKAFEKVNGVKVPYQIVERRPGDNAVTYADPSKSRELLQWQAEYTLADMCRDSWHWQASNPTGYAD